MGNLVHDFGPSLVVVVGFIAQALILHGRRGNDLQALSQWRDRHEIEANTRDEGIAQLRVIAAAMQATADSMKTQLAIVQQELRDNRMRKGS